MHHLDPLWRSGQRQSPRFAAQRLLPGLCRRSYPSRSLGSLLCPLARLLNSESSESKRRRTTRKQAPWPVAPLVSLESLLDMSLAPLFELASHLPPWLLYRSTSFQFPSFPSMPSCLFTLVGIYRSAYCCWPQYGRTILKSIRTNAQICAGLVLRP